MYRISAMLTLWLTFGMGMAQRFDLQSFELYTPSEIAALRVRS